MLTFLSYREVSHGQRHDKVVGDTPVGRVAEDGDNDHDVADDGDDDDEGEEDAGEDGLPRGSLV